MHDILKEAVTNAIAMGPMVLLQGMRSAGAAIRAISRQQSPDV